MRKYIKREEVALWFDTWNLRQNMILYITLTIYANDVKTIVTSLSLSFNTLQLYVTQLNHTHGILIFIEQILNIHSHVWKSNYIVFVLHSLHIFYFVFTYFLINLCCFKTYIFPILIHAKVSVYGWNLSRLVSLNILIFIIFLHFFVLDIY